MGLTLKLTRLGRSPSSLSCWTDSVNLDAVLDAARRWARSNSRIRAVALVGSHVRNTPRADSDIDLVVLSVDPDALADDSSWFGRFGSVALVRSQTWGVVLERRLQTAAGLEIEVNIAPLTWAVDDPVDPGTRQVVRGGGCRIIYDPDNLPERLLRSIGSN